MKGGLEHRVPLSDAALVVLEKQAALRTNDYVFAGACGAGHPGANLLRQVLHRLGRRDLTAHGFRSTFTDWVREETSFPIEVRKLAIAHTVGDKVDEAYARGVLFKKRRQLADAWARYCAGGAVVQFPVRQSA